MKMNKMHLGALMGVAFATSLASNALGAMVMLKNPGDGSYRSGSGGEFAIVPTDAAGVALLFGSTSFYVSGTTSNIVAPVIALSTTFETFCLELGQSFNWNQSMDASISLGAKPGGVGGNGTIDLISEGTAYLYSSFAAGTLSGYTYTAGASRAASAAALQNAIWYLEDEITFAQAGGAGNAFLNDVITQVGSLVTAKLDNTSYAGVAALNLGGPPAFGNQDQLIMTDTPLSVPDGGATVMLMGLSLSALAGLRRKLA